ncbi:hypothetical protein J4E93_004932 [Alternaria ventricosa]|uniref:uncharacterized protein n=1 Tax=Alternaria ventricosa TaxID=1187951 RepID=UPI0020C5977D|nr:uncharacterized protein J4E93_004932 [Alternaria ventricosa]KAI4646709.1 hypothetical protein J4E93_004932 [Alternaria ventricosa]
MAEFTHALESSPCLLLKLSSHPFQTIALHPRSIISEKKNRTISNAGTADDFDRNPSLVHELVLRIANPDLGHPSMDWIRANRSLVDILLYRHYQRYGGLMLPPTAPALQVMQQHEAAIAAARAAGVHPDNYPHIMFPAFGPPPPGEGEVGSPGGKGKGKMAPGKPSGSPPGKGNPFGSIGDRGGFGRGGPSGGGYSTALEDYKDIEYLLAA